MPARTAIPLPRRPEDGFTLLEVLVAVAILALSLSSLLGSQIDSLRATRYAHGVTAAAFLAEYQLHEIEWLQTHDGWQESDVEYEGDFDDQGWPDIEYVCTVDFIELPEYNQMLEAKTDADAAAGEDSMLMDTGDQAFSALGLVWPIVKQAVESSIRKASCTVMWKDGKLEHEFTAQTFWTDPQRLAEIPALGGEFTAEDDQSQDAEGGGSSPDGTTPSGSGAGDPMIPPSQGGRGGGGSQMGGPGK
jgi:general secretion pathway protein I